MQKSISSIISIFNLISILTLLFSSFLFAGAPDTLWTRTYGGTKDEYCYQVQQTSDGGFILVGSTSSLGTTEMPDVYVIRTDSNGDTIWTKTYGGDSTDIGYSIQQTSDGGFIITGSTNSFGDSNDDVYLVRIDSIGDTLWTRTYGGAKMDKGSSVQETSDEGFIITGETLSFGVYQFTLYLIKTNSNGDTLWTKMYGEYITRGNSIDVMSNGDCIITGMTLPTGSSYSDVYLIRIDSNGDTLWTKSFGGTDTDEGYSVQQTNDGGFIIAGQVESIDIYLIRTDINGNQLWAKVFGGDGSDLAYSAQQTSDGGFIVAGHLYRSNRINLDVYLIRTDSNGDTLWTKTFDNSDWDVGYSGQQTSDGGFIIAGYTMAGVPLSRDFYLIRLDKDSTGIQDEIPFNFLNPNDFIVSYNNNNLISIRYTIQYSSSVNLSMYNISGQLVKTLFNEYKNAGNHTINFKTDNISAGVYYFKLYAGESSYTQKAVVVK